jgi:hypothetical protein
MSDEGKGRKEGRKEEEMIRRKEGIGRTEGRKRT